MTELSPDRETIAVLLIDDDDDQLMLLSRALKSVADDGIQDEYDIQTFTDPAMALANVSTLDSAVVVCDYMMPGGTGLDWLPDFIRAGSGPVILLTGQGDERIAARAFREGAADYLTKSAVLADPAMLCRCIRESRRRDRFDDCNNDLARQLRAANTSLAKQNATLAELTDTAHRFVDNVAHEFRTPLTVIREFASILRDGIGGTLNDTQCEYIEYIIGATGDLAHLVDDFLDSGRLKSRTLRVDRRGHDAAAVLEQTRTTIQARAANKRIEIIEQIDPDVGTIFCDLDKAGRALINFAINAIKFSPNGEKVVIDCRPTGNGDVRFAITDHGPGLPPDDIECIFERFKQVGDVQRSPIKGFGLGLNIARELVWLNLGSIDVSSEQGNGSTFSFTVPVNDPAIIVERYLRLIVQADDDRRVTVLECLPTGNTVTAEQMRCWLAGTCYPTDVALPSMDGNSVILLGKCDEPDRWIERLDQVRSRTASETDDTRNVPMQIKWIGSWAHPEKEDFITDCAVGKAMGRNCCA